MKKKLENYYYNSLKKKEAPYAKTIKTFFKHLFIFIILVSVLVYYVDNILIVTLLSLGGFHFFYYSNKKIEKKKMNKFIKGLRNNISQEIFWKRIKGMDKDDFVVFIQSVLEGLPQFTEVTKSGQEIDLEAKFNDENIVITCHLLDGENAVEAYSARELSRFMSKNNFDKGIIISSTDFRESTKTFCEIIKEKRKILLLARHDLLEMARDADKLPLNSEIDDAILKRIEYKERAWKHTQEKIFAKSNLSNYILGGFFLLIFGIFMEGKINLLYYVASFLLFSFGAISFWVGIKKENIDYKWEDKII
ncbi:Restriction endonuclease [Desulfonispora thiosulfatigenes DSM 11270]|uniref:Restriction endonuclease n=1 Tax=Desulfonispora thiosulfatigenes DSM 11270 TaxID=656914 RepID=A0A1W1VH28_DESTI|nr:restriction endonuclease [Desulfonispora thiosulfatigenes]SMB92652.1 Restriction endonuclease [Desulfonispora thiosulfatigenes DSM 11270]